MRRICMGCKKSYEDLKMGDYGYPYRCSTCQSKTKKQFIASRINKKFYVLWIAVFITVFLLSATYVNASLGTFKLNDCVNIKTILNSSYVNISTLSYPNSTIAISNKVMAKSGYTFTYNFCNTTSLGTYIYDYFDDVGNVYVNDFEITTTGNVASINTIFFYLGIVIVFLVFLALCLFSFFNFNNLLNKVGMIGLSYLIIVAISFIGWQMANDFLSKTAFVTSMIWIIFLVLMVGALPLFIGSFAWYIIMISNIKEIQGLMEHGYSLDEANERTSRRKR